MKPFSGMKNLTMLSDILKSLAAIWIILLSIAENKHTKFLTSKKKVDSLFPSIYYYVEHSPNPAVFGSITVIEQEVDAGEFTVRFLVGCR